MKKNTKLVESGDDVHLGDPVVVDRYTLGARINHWITAVTLILLALSGFALYHPSLYFMTGLFGGGQITRAIHPWMGVILFFSFAFLFFRFWKQNLWIREDGTWLARLRDVIAGNEENLPEVGKYNVGQKLLFWSMTLLILVLIGSGIAIWERYFSGLVTIDQRRIAVFIHAIAAVMIVCIWILHVYAAFWVRGTLRAMTRGSVTGGWAWRHHRKWLRELVVGKAREGEPATRAAE